VEVILSLVALREGLLDVLRASLLGSILSNLLLVTGFCFLLGGIRHKEQSFNRTAANTSASLLAVAVMSLLVPAAFAVAMKTHGGIDETINHQILVLSRGTAVILLVIYVLYLYFQLSSHADLYNSDTEALEGVVQEEETPCLSVPFAVFLLFASTIMVAVCSFAWPGGRGIHLGLKINLEFHQSGDYRSDIHAWD
jgi:Ca2+:H+ antiporter